MQLMSPAIFEVVLHINLRDNIFKRFDKIISPRKINEIISVEFEFVNHNFPSRLKSISMFLV